MRAYIAAALHRLGHRLDPFICRCALEAYQKGWQENTRYTLRTAELRGMGLPTTAEEWDEAKWHDFEQWIRENAA